MGDVSVTVTVIDDAEQWRQLSPLWNDLLEKSASTTFFLTWEWLWSWARCCLGEGRTLFILLFHDNAELVGIAPLYLQTRNEVLGEIREIRFIGTPDAGSDYLDVFARKGKEKVVAEALYDYLMAEARERWDVLYLTDVPANALFLIHFHNRVQTEGKHCEVGFSAFCPEVRLPPTEDELFSGLSWWRKKKIKQDLRVLRREPDVAHAVLVGQAIGPKLDQFFALYGQKAGVSGGKIRSVIEELLAQVDDHGPVQLDLLSVAGKAIAGLLHFSYGGTLAMYLMAVDKQFNRKLSLGNLLVGLCLKNAVGKREVYDFLRGEESYKFHWATGGRTTMQLILWQKRPVAVASALARLGKQAGKLLLR